jgi:hypothetical protein
MEESKNFTGGEWGLFPVVASLRMALMPPPVPEGERKNFSNPSSKFSAHAVNLLAQFLCFT